MGHRDAGAGHQRRANSSPQERCRESAAEWPLGALGQPSHTRRASTPPVQVHSCWPQDPAHHPAPLLPLTLPRAQCGSPRSRGSFAGAGRGCSSPGSHSVAGTAHTPEAASSQQSSDSIGGVEGSGWTHQSSRHPCTAHRKAVGFPSTKGRGTGCAVRWPLLIV